MKTLDLSSSRIRAHFFPLFHVIVFSEKNRILLVRCRGSGSCVTVKLYCAVLPCWLWRSSRNGLKLTEKGVKQIEVNKSTLRKIIVMKRWWWYSCFSSGGYHQCWIRATWWWRSQGGCWWTYKYDKKEKDLICPQESSFVWANCNVVLSDFAPSEHQRGDKDTVILKTPMLVKMGRKSQSHTCS